MNIQIYHERRFALKPVFWEHEIHESCFMKKITRNNQQQHFFSQKKYLKLSQVAFFFHAKSQ